VDAGVSNTKLRKANFDCTNTEFQEIATLIGVRILADSQ
jgi:hypothetical protein